MERIKSGNSNIFYPKYTVQNPKCPCDTSRINVLQEIADESLLSGLLCKKLIVMLYILIVGLLTAVLLFTIHTMLVVQNMDMFIRLHFKTHTTTPMMMETSESTLRYKFTTEATPTTSFSTIPSLTDDIPAPDTLQIVRREQWNADFPKGVAKFNSSLDMIIISHTATQNCNTSVACEKLIKSIQRYHMEERHWWDIGYNFIVGGDGKVYEGRGWNCIGSHTSGYNRKSIGIAFTGDFETKIPYRAQIEACKELIRMGVRWGYIDKRYKLFGASQLVPTKSPGKALLEEMETWPHTKLSV